MFWSICLTDSYIDSINLHEIDKTRNLFELLDNVKNNQNLIIGDDTNFKNLYKLKDKIYKEKISPAYQAELVSIFAELWKQTFIENNSGSKSKFLNYDISNTDDYEFVENLSFKKITDGVIVSAEDTYFRDLSKENFEIIEDKKDTGIKFSELVKKSKEYFSSGIPKRQKNNLSEIGKIINNCKEVNFIAYNFIDKIYEFYEKELNHNIEFKEINKSKSMMIGTIYFLVNLIYENEIKHDKKNKTCLNIITPMTSNRKISNIDEIKKKLLEIFTPEKSLECSALKKLRDNGNQFFINVISRKDRRDISTMHTRGIFTDFCNVSTEWDELCWHSGRQITKVNEDLILDYSPNMRVNEIIALKNNEEICTKIKIF